MAAETLEFACNRTEERLGAVLDLPESGARRSAILFAHGAGVDMLAPWMASAARALVERGFAVMRFRYPYMERAVRERHPIPPDRAELLEAAHLAALDELRRRLPRARVLLGGKSLGARFSTVIAAKGADCAGLVLYGYPLHPPREPAERRSEHFASIAQPALFLQGTRDEFGSPDELRDALSRYAGRATLSIVERGDHSLALPAGARRSIADVLGEAAERVSDWERATWPE